MTTVKSLRRKSSGDDSSDGDAEEMLVKFEYHVLFSSSYEVPILYFQASHSGKHILEMSKTTSRFTRKIQTLFSFQYRRLKLDSGRDMVEHS